MGDVIRWVKGWNACIFSTVGVQDGDDVFQRMQKYWSFWVECLAH